MSILPLSSEEFAAMERLLANLLPHADTPQEEEAACRIHERVIALYAAGEGRRKSKAHLKVVLAQARPGEDKG